MVSAGPAHLRCKPLAARSAALVATHVHAHRVREFVEFASERVRYDTPYHNDAQMTSYNLK